MIALGAIRAFQPWRRRPQGVRPAVLRLLDRMLMTLLMLLSAALQLVWMRSYVVGDRYRWVELIEVDDGQTILRTGDVWTGEGGLALIAQRQSTHDPRGGDVLRRRAERRARWGVGLMLGTAS